MPLLPSFRPRQLGRLLLLMRRRRFLPTPRLLPLSPAKLPFVVPPTRLPLRKPCSCPPGGSGSRPVLAVLIPCLCPQPMGPAALPLLPSFRPRQFCRLLLLMRRRRSLPTPRLLPLPPAKLPLVVPPTRVPLRKICPCPPGGSGSRPVLAVLVSCLWPQPMGPAALPRPPSRWPHQLHCRLQAALVLRLLALPCSRLHLPLLLSRVPRPPRIPARCPEPQG